MARRAAVARDGVVHASYTFKRQAIKHSVVSEDWIMKGDVLSGSLSPA
jgi:hypothetical protein